MLVLLLAPSLLLAQGPPNVPKASVADPAITDSLVRAYFDGFYNGHSEPVIQANLKRIINGGEYSGGQRLKEFLVAIETGEKNSNVPAYLVDGIKIIIFFNRSTLAISLMHLADNEFRVAIEKVQGTKDEQGKISYVIPQEVYETQRYITYAKDVLKDDGFFKGHTDEEEINKLRANLLRSIDLFFDQHKSYISYLESFNSPNANKEEFYRKSEEAKMVYETEGKKLVIYMNRKNNFLLGKYSSLIGAYYDPSKGDSIVNKLAKELKRAEKDAKLHQ